MRTRRTLPVLFAIAAVTALAACGDDDEPADTTEPAAAELPATVAPPPTEEAAEATEPLSEGTEPMSPSEPMGEATEPMSPTEPMASPSEPMAEATEPMAPVSEPAATGPVMSMPEGSVPMAEIAGLQLAAEEALVGETEEDAAAIADEEGWTLRVMRIDGEDQQITMDFRPDRVNVAVEDGVVAEIVDVG